MRTFAFLLVVCTILSADVVELKDGERISGRVKVKGDHYEVTTPEGRRTYLKEEVERVITDPTEILGVRGEPAGGPPGRPEPAARVPVPRGPPRATPACHLLALPGQGPRGSLPQRPDPSGRPRPGTGAAGAAGVGWA